MIVIFRVTLIVHIYQKCSKFVEPCVVIILRVNRVIFLHFIFYVKSIVGDFQSQIGIFNILHSSNMISRKIWSPKISNATRVVLEEPAASTFWLVIQISPQFSGLDFVRNLDILQSLHYLHDTQA